MEHIAEIYANGLQDITVKEDKILNERLKISVSMDKFVSENHIEEQIENLSDLFSNMDNPLNL